MQRRRIFRSKPVYCPIGNGGKISAKDGKYRVNSPVGLFGLPLWAIWDEKRSMQKEYRERRTARGTLVTVEGRALNPRHDLHHHSLEGIE